MRSVIVLLLALAVAVPAFAGPPEDPAQERAAVERAVRDYLEGWYTGDAARMERALHPELVKRMVGVEPRTGRAFLDTIGASGMIAFTAAGSGKLPAGEDPAIEVTILDVFRDMAMVRGRSAHFMDYVQLAKVDGQWKIVNVLWESTAPPRLPPAAAPKP
jgi:hypothetical protein